MNDKDRTEIIKKFEKGVLLRNFSGELTYEIEDRWYEQYNPAKKRIAKEFGLVPISVTVFGPDESFQTFYKRGMKLSIEWDTWSGLIFVAKNCRAEKLVLEIAGYCEENEI
ncbi:hypothetical protein ACG1BZ_09735 [Microbulbifer sp. CNSA002]|uniref:hypothetical protein n=1 Tax=unclassified Microbulbifer TaxID=2619833 RepID=UPI0039B3B635